MSTTVIRSPLSKLQDLPPDTTVNVTRKGELRSWTVTFSRNPKAYITEIHRGDDQNHLDEKIVRAKHCLEHITDYLRNGAGFNYFLKMVKGGLDAARQYDLTGRNKVFVDNANRAVGYARGITLIPKFVGDLTELVNTLNNAQASALKVVRAVSDFLETTANLALVVLGFAEKNPAALQNLSAGAGLVADVGEGVDHSQQFMRNRKLLKDLKAVNSSQRAQEIVDGKNKVLMIKIAKCVIGVAAGVIGALALFWGAPVVPLGVVIVLACSGGAAGTIAFLADNIMEDSFNAKFTSMRRSA